MDTTAHLSGTGYDAHHNIIWRPGRTGPDAADSILVSWKQDASNGAGCDGSPSYLYCYGTVERFNRDRGFESSSKGVNPLFTSPTGGNFLLCGASPAIDCADTTVTGWVTVDAAGLARTDHAAVTNSGSIADRGPYEALDTAPATITNFDPECAALGAYMTWTANGEDGNCGTGAKYWIRRSTSAINNTTDFWNATHVDSGVPLPAGTTQCVANNPPLERCKTYYYAVMTRDVGGQYSPISSASCVTLCSGYSDGFCDGGEGFIRDGGGEEESASLGLAGVPQVLEIGAPTPNPAVDGAVMAFGFPYGMEGLPYEISLFDVAGRRIATVVRGIASAGRYTQAIRFAHRDGGLLSNGVYFVKFIVGDRKYTRTLVLAR